MLPSEKVSRATAGGEHGHEPNRKDFMTQTESEALDAVVERIIALRDVTRTTGTITKRSQSLILQKLPDDVLAEVAVRIARQEALGAALGGR
jgi:hypothetical protein